MKFVYVLVYTDLMFVCPSLNDLRQAISAFMSCEVEPNIKGFGYNSYMLIDDLNIEFEPIHDAQMGLNFQCKQGEFDDLNTPSNGMKLSELGFEPYD